MASSSAVRWPAAHRGQPSLNVFDRTGEVLNQLRPVVEADDEELVLGIGGLDELQNRFARADQLGSHGAGEIEDDADGDRGVFAGKARDLLLAVVLIDLKVFLFQAGDQAVERIGDGDRHQHHVDIHADERTGMDLERRSAGFGGRFSPAGLVRRSCRSSAGGCDVDLVELIVLRASLTQAKNRGQRTNSRRAARQHAVAAPVQANPQLGKRRHVAP